MSRKSNGKQSEFCYSSMESLFSSAKQPRQLGETISEYRARMISTYPELRQSIAVLCDAQNIALFSEKALLSKQTAKSSNEALMRVLNHRYPRPKRDYKTILQWIGFARLKLSERTT